MKGPGKSIAAVSLAALMLAACGGGGGGGSSAPPVTVTPTPTPTPTPSASCSLSSRQAFAKAVIDEWYLFPNDVATVNASSYGDVQSYIDALLAPARAQGKDRHFTYITSIAEEEAYYTSGASAGFGVRLAYDPYAQVVVIAEAYEDAPALDAGIDRGARISAIGTSSGNMRSISSIVASQGTAGIIDALGPDTAGVTRVLRVSDASGTRNVTVTKAEYDIDPISDRYGAKVIQSGGRSYGYVNLRTFINSAAAQLRAAFQDFRDKGITDVVIDLRYNGGGLVSVADLFGDLLGRDRSTSDLFSQLKFRPEKAAEEDSRHLFTAQPEAIAPTRIAFIGTLSTASASELVINGMLPYLGANMTLVGDNTYGKPVGQVALDNAGCDDRMRVIAFALANADGQGDYYDGLASRIPNSCAAADDLSLPLGDPREASVSAAIGFLSGQACTTRIADTRSASADRRTGAPARGPDMLVPAKPTTAQRELPGLF